VVRGEGGGAAGAVDVGGAGVECGRVGGGVGADGAEVADGGEGDEGGRGEGDCGGVRGGGCHAEVGDGEIGGEVKQDCTAGVRCEASTRYHAGVRWGIFIWVGDAAEGGA